jgi:PadR family transcriptional regulator, regulatory protein PadR
MRQRHFGQFEQILLYAVRHLQGDTDGASGPSIRKLIEAQTGRTVSPGAIFTALDRLEQRGFMKSRMGDPTPERGGKRKRLYEMRAAGDTALRSVEASLRSMARLSQRKA